jgi:hypothetical protein
MEGKDMSTARYRSDDNDRDPSAQMPGETANDPVSPWEQIENGRYMPRRIRGSFRGRELG